MPFCGAAAQQTGVSTEAQRRLSNQRRTMDTAAVQGRLHGRRVPVISLNFNTYVETYAVWRRGAVKFGTVVNLFSQSILAVRLSLFGLFCRPPKGCAKINKLLSCHSK